MKNLFFEPNFVGNVSGEKHGPESRPELSFLTRVIKCYQPVESAEEKDQHDRKLHNFPKGFHIFNLFKRVQVHAFSLYSTPLMLASVATGTTGTVPGATVHAETPSLMSLLTNFLQGLDFSQVLILLLIASLFFKDEIRVLMTKYLGVKPNGAGTQQKLQNTMDELQLHFNDETTHLLTDILGASKRAADHAEKSFQILQEFKEYGIRQRSEK